MFTHTAQPEWVLECMLAGTTWCIITAAAAAPALQGGGLQHPITISTNTSSSQNLNTNMGELYVEAPMAILEVSKGCGQELGWIKYHLNLATGRQAGFHPDSWWLSWEDL